ncbi:hypothetical protein IE53DRAFT_368297 [Violaceomyces palustris]|uniref:Uncharacterized protein n=1 Tax=Violaceomyces palustris TaxID=1673888 RepID=A0ACD0NZH5_9BASI|nr:hypothetical protein IE53DRAFT_368297 [Violaceomyces palustris]
MPPAPVGSSSRRKQGEPTVCLECYKRKVKCDRLRPCGTCVRRGTEHLCKTFSTRELDPEELKRKQSRRSIAEITQLENDGGPSPDSNQGYKSSPSPESSTSQPPLTSFINLLLKDLSIDADESHSEDGNSPSLGVGSQSSSPSRYSQESTLDKVWAFCSIVPDWPQLARLVRFFLTDVDWRLMVTCQDDLEAFCQGLYKKIIAPCHAHQNQRMSHRGLLKAIMEPNDLSSLAFLCGIMLESIESSEPSSIEWLLPASKPGSSRQGPVALEPQSSARVRALYILKYHIQALVEECSEIDEMTLELAQANVSAFNFWANQGLFGASDFPKWEITVNAASRAKLFEDPESSGLARHRLDHHRRLAYLLYGYDRSYAVGANTSPIISESQFSVGRPSDDPIWSASGSPPDPCLAMLEVNVAKLADSLASVLCNGKPLHRKVMEVDAEFLKLANDLPPWYSLDKPDYSRDAIDPFLSRRRPWLKVNMAWQRVCLHRVMFFPDGKINNGELATSRYIAVSSAMQAMEAISVLRKESNRFSDRQGSGWYFQYITEPSITLATAALLLIRSKGRGVQGLSEPDSCWPTVFHIVQILDRSIIELENTYMDPELSLPTFINFAKRCSQIVTQLKSAIHEGINAVMSNAGIDSSRLKLDEKLTTLLNPRAIGTSSPRPRSSGESARNELQKAQNSWVAASHGRRPSESSAAPSNPRSGAGSPASSRLRSVPEHPAPGSSSAENAENVLRWVHGQGGVEHVPSRRGGNPLDDPSQQCENKRLPMPNQTDQAGQAAWSPKARLSSEGCLSRNGTGSNFVVQGVGSQRSGSAELGYHPPHPFPTYNEKHPVTMGSTAFPMDDGAAGQLDSYVVVHRPNHDQKTISTSGGQPGDFNVTAVLPDASAGVFAPKTGMDDRIGVSCGNGWTSSFDGGSEGATRRRTETNSLTKAVVFGEGGDYNMTMADPGQGVRYPPSLPNPTKQPAENLFRSRGPHRSDSLVSCSTASSSVKFSSTLPPLPNLGGTCNQSGEFSSTSSSPSPSGTMTVRDEGNVERMRTSNAPSLATNSGGPDPVNYRASLNEGEGGRGPLFQPTKQAPYPTPQEILYRPNPVVDQQKPHPVNQAPPDLESLFSTTTTTTTSIPHQTALNPCLPVANPSYNDQRVPRADQQVLVDWIAGVQMGTILPST